MKAIKSFDEISKYSSPNYEKVDDGIYKFNDCFVTCLSFQQEPDYGEGINAADISQYPLEDILNRFSVYISDFYREKNIPKSETCILEFTGFSLADIRRLRTIIGKRVYNHEVQDNGKKYVELMIE